MAKFKAMNNSYSIEYDYIHGFVEGLAFVRNKDKKCGYINESGAVVIPLDYEGSADGRFVFPFFSEGLAALFKNGKLGFVDQSGNVVIDFQYDYAYTFQDGLCGVRKDGQNGIRYGFINKRGEEVIPIEYDWVYYFSDGLAPAKRNGKLGYIDKFGNTAIPFVYDKTDSGDTAQFINGTAVVMLNGKKLRIDRNGTPLEAE
ncbi:MAG: WG repeat-containing protein [Oscillospiraceae bacterium]|nr:WG repeat-containing protein [Oscillospiraceae bacterium]